MTSETSLAERVIEAAAKTGVMISTAESCTGGLIAAALTDVAGSSAVFERGFVTYSNEAKNELLGVPTIDIERNGAVSAIVAQAMADGALRNSRAQLSVSVTGVAGPGGGSDEKPVGLVYIGVQRAGFNCNVRECRFADQGAAARAEVRAMTVDTALAMLLDALGDDQ